MLLLPLAAGQTCQQLAGFSVCSAGRNGTNISITFEQTCPLNSNTLSSSASAVTDCKCKAGTYGPIQTTSSVCQFCLAGTYSPTVGANGSSTCLSCAVGTYSTAVGAVASSTCVECPVGMYCSTVGTAPLNCTNGPAHSTYSSTAVVSTGCQWYCNDGYYLSDNGCSPCPPGSWCHANAQNVCPTLTFSAPLSVAQRDCLCVAGSYGNGSTSPCVQCAAGSYCPGDNGNTTVTCPGNSTSPAGSNLLTQCQCIPGFVGANGTNCTLCPPNTVCASGALSQCPANSAAPIGSSSSLQCVANPGFYQTKLGGAPIQCPANSYCTGGLNLTNCTANAVSPPQSTSALACS